MKNPINKPSEFLLDARYSILGEKEGGKKSAGDEGGTYTYTDADGTHTLIVKCETDKKERVQPHKVIAEYLGAVIVGALVPDAVPQTYLMSVPPGTKAIKKEIKKAAEEGRASKFTPEAVARLIPENVPNDDVGHEVYLASVFFEKYKSFSEIGLHVRDPARSPGQETVGFSKARMRRKLYERDGQGVYTKSCFANFDDLIGVSVLINDFDIISTNIGATPIHSSYEKDENGTEVLVYRGTKDTHAVRLDFGEGMGKLEDEVHIHSHTRHPFGFGPTNHVREIPRSVKVSHHFADALAGICSDEKRKKLYKAIDRGVEKASKFYGMAPLQAFAKHAGFKDAVKCLNKEELVTELKGYLNAKMETRMDSLRRLEMEIRLSLCFERQSGVIPCFKVKSASRDPKSKEKSLKVLMDSDPLYFIKGDFHFRKKDQRFNFGVFKYRYKSLQEQMRDIVNANMNQFISVAVRDGKPAILEALQLNKKLNSNMDEQKYTDSVVACGAVLLTNKKRKALVMRNSIVEEILLEKSIPHRAKMIERYLMLFKLCDEANDLYNEGDRLLLRKVIRAALHNPAIRRLPKTQNQEQFYAEQQRALRRANPPRKRRRINPVMQAKWLQLSEGCLPTPVLTGLVAKESRLFVSKRISRDLKKVRSRYALRAKA